MDRADVLQIYNRPGIEPPAFLFSLSCASSQLIVMMAEPIEQVSGLYMLDLSGRAMRSDVGVVVSSRVADIAVGDTVVVVPTAGTWRDNFTLDGEEVCPNQVRFLGVASLEDGSPVVLEPWELVVGKIGDGMDDLKPYGQYVVVKRDAPLAASGGILLPEQLAWRSNQGEVVSVGNRVCVASPGDRVIYNPMGWESAQNYIIDNTGSSSDYVLMHENAIEAIVSARNQEEPAMSLAK